MGSGTLKSLVESDGSILLDRGAIDVVNEFCYLGDMLDSEGGAERVVRHRIYVAWFNWRNLRSLLTTITIPLRHCARAFDM